VRRHTRTDNLMSIILALVIALLATTEENRYGKKSWSNL